MPVGRVPLEVDAEVKSVREFTVFWLFFFIQAGNTPLHYAASSGLYQCVQVCTTVFTLLAVSFFPHSWRVSRLNSTALSGLATDGECRLIFQNSGWWL